MERRDGGQRHREFPADPLHGAAAETIRRRPRGVRHLGAASKATAYLGPYAASKAALETLARAWAQETASTNIRVNLFNPGPIRTRMRATVFPGEDPETLDTPEQAAEFIVPMCAPEWNETGKLYDYKTRTLMSFRAGVSFSTSLRANEAIHSSLRDDGLLRFARNDGVKPLTPPSPRLTAAQAGKTRQ